MRDLYREGRPSTRVDIPDFTIAVFDMDGTLYSTDNSVVPAVLETFRDFGLDEPPVAEIEDLIGRPDTHYHAWLREKGGVDLDAEKYATRYTQRLFYNDATPGFLIEYPEIPEAEQRKKIREEWDEIHQGWRNARKTGFLWGGAKASSVALVARAWRHSLSMGSPAT